MTGGHLHRRRATAAAHRSSSADRRRRTTRRLLSRDGLRVDHVVATATSSHPTALRAVSSHLLVLPYAGVFATHFVRRDAPVTGANQALLMPPDSSIATAIPVPAAIAASH